MEAICFFETSVDVQRTTWLYIPEDSTLHNYRCENLKSYMFRKMEGVCLELLGCKKPSLYEILVLRNWFLNIFPTGVG
jgi:hypothetical protein